MTRDGGRPFFWLGDTAWRLPKMPPDDIERYLSHRARHGFNIIQVSCGFDVTDYAGNQPFLKNDTNKPNEAFWRNLDGIVASAHDHGIYIALVPMWGDEYDKAFGADAEQAYRLGQWLGERYAPQSHVLWIVSGEYDAINHYRLPVTEAQKIVLNSMARGLRDAHGGRQIMTIHPGVILTSSKDFHREPWLNFNMLQSGHFSDSRAYKVLDTHELIVRDYALTPAKPVLDGEPLYEDTPDAVWRVRHVDGPRAGAAAIRRKAYLAVFSGAFGHTYGHNDVCIFFEPAYPGQMPTPVSKPPGSGQRNNWRDVSDAEGFCQMKHLRALMESRPFLSRIPDASLLASGTGCGLASIGATRDSVGSYAMIYAPPGARLKVRMDKIAGSKVIGWWFDPRNGSARSAGVFKNEGEREFTPPSLEDWVLVLDDGSRKFPPPGRVTGLF